MNLTTDEIDWQLTTYEGNRRREHQEFHALSFREKLQWLEDASAVAEHFRYIFYGLLLVPWAIVYAHTARHCRANELKQTMFRMQRCPSCAYPIDNVPADADGRTVCPRCGSAWRIPLTSWTPTVRDGRERAIRLFDPELAQLTQTRGNLTREQLADLSKRSETSWNVIRHGSVRKSIPFVAILLVGLILFVVVFSGEWVDKPVADTAITLIGAAYLFGCFVLWWMYMRQRRRHRVLQWFLEQRHCAVCTYPLAGIPAQPDGCTVCPECGAAWRLEERDGSTDPSRPRTGQDARSDAANLIEADTASVEAASDQSSRSTSPSTGSSAASISGT